MAREVKKLVELDSLRGLMAFWVFLSHVLFLGGYSGNHLKDILSQGGLAVYVFVILSGFAITSSLIHSRNNYGAFMARRFFRIYPAYLVGLALGLATS